MNAPSVLAELRERAARVEVVNGRLRITPKKAVSVEQQDWIVEHKAELLALVACEAEADRRARVATLTLTLERDHGFTRAKAERLASLPVEQMTDDEVGYWAGKVRFAWPAPGPTEHLGAQGIAALTGAPVEPGVARADRKRGRRTPRPSEQGEGLFVEEGARG